MNEYLSTCDWVEQAPGEPAGPPELQVHAVSTQPTETLVPNLLQAIDQASGWVLYRQMISPSILQMRVEAQGRALMHLYASLMEEGLELSRDSHQRLTERCTCAQMHHHAGSSIITLQMNVTLPSDLPLLFSSTQIGSA